MKIKKKKIVFFVLILLVTAFVALAIINNRQVIGLLVLTSQAYEPTEIPPDTTDLFEYDGYIKNELAYIYVQGGPNWELFPREISPFGAIPQSGTYIRVYPYQSQMLNPTILAATPVLTPKQAQESVAVSAEMLYRTITYFKNRNKKVYVFCISHGSQIGLELLRNYPTAFDGLALTMIRIDIDQEAIDLTKDGKVPYYGEDQKVTGRYLLPSILRFERLNNRFENMTMMMKVCRNRYTELLSQKDMSKVVYVYGKYDNMVGKPTQHELSFLKDKDVNILELPCGHDDLGDADYIHQINELLLKNP